LWNSLNAITHNPGKGCLLGLIKLAEACIEKYVDNTELYCGKYAKKMRKNRSQKSTNKCFTAFFNHHSAGCIIIG